MTVGRILQGESCGPLGALCPQGAVTFLASRFLADADCEVPRAHVALLEVNGEKFGYTKYDMPVGLWPHNISVTPNGKIAPTSDKGIRAGGTAASIRSASSTWKSIRRVSSAAWLNMMRQKGS